MITFGNYPHIVYILLAAFLVLALFIAYLLWKRRVLFLFAGGDKGRLILRNSVRLIRLKESLIIVAVLLFAFTALRPQWGERVHEAKNEGVDLLVALDVSRSMLARDVKPDRLGRAKDAVRLLAESLKGDRIGLILFAGDAFLQCPLTNDMGAFMMFLNAAGPASMRLQGTDIGGALEAAARVFEKRRMTSRIFVLITDGEDHEDRVRGGLDRLKELGVSVYTAGIGGTLGETVPSGEGENSAEVYFRDSSGRLVRSRKDAGLLRRIALDTGGDYIDITDGLSGVFKILDAMAGQTKNEYGSRVIKEREERYHAFALVLAILLALEAVLPERRKLF